jgi:hypothetical protein
MANITVPVRLISRRPKKKVSNRIIKNKWTMMISGEISELKMFQVPLTVRNVIR